jgi:MFS family permease
MASEGAARSARADLGASFWRLWSADTISSYGDGISFAAFPLLASTITADPRQIALVSVGEYLPWVLFGLLAGVFVDRVDRRRTMWAVDAARTAVLVVFALAIVAGANTVLLLAVVAFLLSSGGLLRDNAASAILPSVVATDRLERANSWLQGSVLLGNSMIGPPLGAVLFSLGHALPFAVDGLTFLAAAALVLSMRTRTVAVSAGAPRRSIGADLREGLAWLRNHALLRTLCVLLLVFNGAGAAALAVLVLYAKTTLGLGPIGYGLLISTYAVGGVLGASAASLARRSLGPYPAIVAAVLMSFAGLLVMGLTVRPVVAALGVIAVGTGSTLWNVLTVSLRQRLVPDQLLGRVTAAYRVVGFAAMPIGAVIGGFVAHRWGLRAPFLLGAASLGLAAIALLPIVHRAVAQTIEE